MSAYLNTLRESATREDLLREIERHLEEKAAAASAHDRRVTELLEANNREVERRRAAEADAARLRAEAATSVQVAAVDRVRHLKRGSTYGVAFRQVEIQTGRPIIEGNIITVYVAEADGTVWGRPVEEFTDGRFEAAPGKAPMKMLITQEWLERKVALEGDHCVEAGVLHPEAYSVRREG